MPADPRYNLVVVCEGEQGSADVQLYSRILLNESLPSSPRYRIQLVPGGGKQGILNFARARAYPYDNYLVIRDRDLDAEPQDGLVTWNKGKQILTGRSCLESYLLSPELLVEYAQAQQLNLMLGLEVCKASLDHALHQIRDYQAVRWALQTLINNSQHDLRNRLTDEDGKLPSKLDEDNLTNRVHQLIQQAQTSQHHLTVAFFQERYEEFKQRFEGDQFWNSEQPYRCGYDPIQTSTVTTMSLGQ